jgi:hypothetical protein
MLEPPKITRLSKIWAKHHVQCQLWRYSRRAQHRRIPCYLCWDLLTQVAQKLSSSMSQMLSLAYLTMWSFQIHVECMDIIVKCTIVDEGASTSVMSLSCWKSIGSPQISQSMTMLTTFDGRSFRPHGILPTFLVQLGGKTMAIEVEVVDAPLDYNILLGCNWIYAMSVVMSSVFHVLCFPHEGKIVTIDQLYFSCSNPLHRWDPRSPLSRIIRRKLRTLVSECILL